MNKPRIPYLRCEACGKKGVYPHPDMRRCRYCGDVTMAPDGVAYATTRAIAERAARG